MGFKGTDNYLRRQLWDNGYYEEDDTDFIDAEISPDKCPKCNESKKPGFASDMVVKCKSCGTIYRHGKA